MRGAPPPAQLGNAAATSDATAERSPDLFPLLTGCWSYHHSVRGFDLCWERRGESWHGRWEATGSFAQVRTIALAITRDGERIELSVTPSNEWFKGFEHVELMAAAEDVALFGSGAQRVRWQRGESRDELVLAVGAGRPRTYVLRRLRK